MTTWHPASLSRPWVVFETPGWRIVNISLSENKGHLTDSTVQLPLQVFYGVVLHVLRLVAPLLHDQGEDPKGDSIHGEGTDDSRANPTE